MNGEKKKKEIKKKENGIEMDSGWVRWIMVIV